MRDKNEEEITKTNYKKAVKAAKQRMLNGYSAGAKGGARVYSIDRRRAKFLKEVYAIINCGEIVSNPIERLSDRKLMASMNDVERSRYVLDLSREYLEETKFIIDNDLTPEKIDELTSGYKGKAS